MTPHDAASAPLGATWACHNCGRTWTDGDPEADPCECDGEDMQWELLESLLEAERIYQAMPEGSPTREEIEHDL